MKQKKFKLCIVICFIAITFGLCYNINIMYSNANTELTNIDTSSIFEYIKKIDCVLFRTTCINKSCSFSSSQMLDICIQYIICNHDLYKDKITLENNIKEYIDDNGSVYYIYGYVKTDTMLKVLREIFGDKSVDMSKCKLYDPISNCFLLVPLLDEYAFFDSSKLLNVTKSDNDNYTAIVEYTRLLNLASNTFKVKYTLSKKDDNFYLKHMEIYDSTLKKGG